MWDVTFGPIAAGACRYNFSVDGVLVIDPRNPSVSESNDNVWSLFYIPGSDDWLIGTTMATVEMLKKHGFEAIFKESPGGLQARLRYVLERRPTRQYRVTVGELVLFA